MSFAYAYPKSRFEPAVLVDLSARSERERLSESALKGFFRLAGAWQIVAIVALGDSRAHHVGSALT